MKLHTVLVTAFGFGVLLACALPACAQSQEEEQIVRRIETSKGICECVFYTNCSVEDTVDTTVFRIRNRGKRQIEEQSEQCNGGKVCCLVNKTPPTQRPKEEKEPLCECLPKDQCGKNDTAVLNGGAGIIQKRQEDCSEGEVICCDGSFVGSQREQPLPPRRTPTEGPMSCGTRSVKIGFNINRITTAEGSTTFGEYPWMLVILKSKETIVGSENEFVCGASLIQRGLAITAAHCVDKLKAEDLKVRAGEWDSRDEDTSEVEPFQERGVTEVIIHPEYNNKTLYNDVAILKLKKPFILNDYVNSICLPEENFLKEPTTCVATGWGKEDFSLNARYADVLKQVALPLVPPDECEKKLQRTKLGKSFTLHKSYTCAGGVRDQDTCTGDGGGPLSCIVRGDDRFYLIGITAWGIGCGQKDVPGVYANVRLLSGWISQQLD